MKVMLEVKGSWLELGGRQQRKRRHEAGEGGEWPQRPAHFQE